MEKSCRKCALKASPIILLNNLKQPLHARNSFKNKIFWKGIMCYISSDQVWWCNVKQFLSYSKHYICKFMQVNSWHHKLFHFHLSLWIWNMWKGREKNTKIWTSWDQKELFMTQALMNTQPILLIILVSKMYRLVLVKYQLKITKVEIRVNQYLTYITNTNRYLTDF